MTTMMETLSKAILEEAQKMAPGVTDVHVSTTGSKKKPPVMVMGDDGVMRPQNDDGEFLDEEHADVEKGDIEFLFTFAKVDIDQRMIFGWASISSVDGVEVVDKQGDVIPISELEPAFYDFVLKSRTLGNMHESTGHGSLVECMLFTPEKQKLGLIAKNEQGQPICGAWVGFYVGDDDLLKDLKAGRRPEFSIGGRSRRIDG